MADIEIITLSQAVETIKTAILQSQARAARNVSANQLALYFSVGGYISLNTRQQQWGSGAIETISERLQKELPGLQGFSPTSIKNMRQFYETWSPVVFRQPLAGELPSKSPVPTDDLQSNLAVPSAELQSNSFVETNKLEPTEQNSFVGTNKLPEVRFSIDANFPITAFMSIGFTHHYAILSQVKTYEERIFYIQFAADYKVKVEDLQLQSIFKTSLRVEN